jgi:hypothetical protein
MMQSNRVRPLAWKITLGVVLIPCAYIVFLVALAFIHRRPPATLYVPIEGDAGANRWPARLNLLTWNLGYGGTGEEADLFMDGGHDVLAKDKTTVLRHTRHIVEVIQHHPEDLYLLQEVDINSRRTYHVNVVELITRDLKHLDSSVALNFDVWFVPCPFTRPTGRVRSGLLSLGANHPAEAARIQLPGSFLWPISAFSLASARRQTNCQENRNNCAASCGCDLHRRPGHFRSLCNSGASWLFERAGHIAWDSIRYGSVDVTRPRTITETAGDMRLGDRD